MAKEIQFNNVEDMVNGSEVMQYNENKRHFDYKMNDKNAKAKLLKGAKRAPFDIIRNSSSINLMFNVGSWKNIVLPSIQYWRQVKEENQTCKIGSSLVRIASIKAGMETGGKHVDTQVVFFMNRDKITCHFYNTTLLVLVNGHGHSNLVEEFLEPYFKSKIVKNEDEIIKYNEEALDVLGGKMVKRSSVRYKSRSTFLCKKCDFAAKTLATLAKHIRNEHGLNYSGNSASIPLDNPKHSTRNNSFSSPENKENMKILDVDQEVFPMIQHIPETLKYTCLECDYKTKTKVNMEKHVESIHEPTVKDVHIICGVCEHKFNQEEDYNIHLENHETKKDTVVKEPISLNQDNVTIENLLSESDTDKLTNIEEISTPTKIHNDEDSHAQNNTNAAQQAHICPFCKNCLDTISAFKIHIENTHMSKNNNPNEILVIRNETCQKCPHCETVGTEAELEEHNRNEHGTKFNCEKCENTFKEPASLSEHVKSAHESKQMDEPFPCEICGSVLMDFNLLKEHIQNFHGEKFSECKYCEYKAQDKEELQNHMENEHMDVVFLHTLGNQVNELYKNREEVSIMRSDFAHLLTSLYEKQNQMCQEISMLKNIITNIPKKLSTDEEKQEKHDEPFKPKEHISNEKIRKRKKKKITWIGTSISANVLDKKKVENDCNIEVNVIKAYNIKEEKETSFFKDANLAATTAKVMKEKETDVLVLESGNIEITDLRTNDAMMDTRKQLENYKQDWFNKVEQDSINLFHIAENALEQNKELEKVVILKRLPRYDRSSTDLLAIKSELSTFANSVLDQQWIKRGSNKQIKVVEIDLKCSESKHLKNIIYGNINDANYDGIHLRGKAASRHFNYRAVQVLKPIFQVTNNNNSVDNVICGVNCQQTLYQRQKRTNQRTAYKSNSKYEQDIKSNSVTLTAPHRRTYASVVQGETNYQYNIPTNNFWNNLNF